MGDRDEEYKQHEAVMTEDGYMLNPPGYERLRTWTFIMHNLHFAAWTIERLLAEKVIQGDISNTYEEYARFTALIVAYARCFVSGIKTLDAGRIFKEAPKLKEMHDRMIGIRHTVFAHGQESEFMQARIGVKEEADKISLMHYFTVMTPRGDFEDYAKVIDHARQYVLLQLNKIAAKKELELGKPIIID